jgi:hypothetical protein
VGFFNKAKQTLQGNPAGLGGPDNTPLAEDDPPLQPVGPVSLEIYADVAKACQAKGIQDEAGMCALAESDFGISAADMKTGMDEWVARMQQSQVVGQRFNKRFLGK